MLFSLFILLALIIHMNTLDFDIVTDYDVNDCLMVDNKEKTKYFALDSYGFPFCSEYGSGEESCQHNEDCKPGLRCESGSCKVDPNSCFKYYVKDNNSSKDLLWTPDCLPDGTWASKQCKGGSAGRCFCYDKKGNRLFGDAFQDESVNMTCACSRRKAELLETRSFVSFHCDSQGNYEKLQCDSGHCWCVEPKTGLLKSKIVPESAVKYLNCFADLNNSKYLRKCESQGYAESKIIEKMKKHGISSPNIQTIACEGDGSYGPYTIYKTIVFCVDKNNARTQFKTPMADIKSVDCNCAKDGDLYDRRGKSFSLICNEHGTYKPLQSVMENNVIKNFCVDKDGNKKLDNVGKQDDLYCNNFYD